MNLSTEEKVRIIGNTDEITTAVKLLAALFFDASLKDHVTITYELLGENYELNFKKMKK